jgi:hypothetical protein
MCSSPPIHHRATPFELLASIVLTDHQIRGCYRDKPNRISNELPRHSSAFIAASFEPSPVAVFSIYAACGAIFNQGTLVLCFDISHQFGCF